MTSVIIEDQNGHKHEHLELLLLEGPESGEPIDVTEDYIQQKRAALLKQIGENAKNAR